MDLENDGHTELMGTERMRDALDASDRFPQLSWSDVRDMIMVGIANPDEKRFLFRACDHMEAHGVIAPWHARGLEARIRAGISDSFQHTEKTGGLTAVASMVFNRRKADMTWQVLSDGPHILASNFREGQFGWISGIPGTGKTVTGLKIIEQWIDMGNEALSNIKLSEPTEGYHYVRSAKEMFLTEADILEEDPLALSLTILDDAGGSKLSKDYATTNRDKDLNRWAKVAVRKLGGNAILIEQREHSVPTIIQEFATSRYFCHKVGGGVVTVDLRGPHRYYLSKIEDMPMTDLVFKTRDVAFFELEDVDFDKVFLALDGTDNVPKAIRKAVKA